MQRILVEIASNLISVWPTTDVKHRFICPSESNVQVGGPHFDLPGRVAVTLFFLSVSLLCRVVTPPNWHSYVVPEGQMPNLRKWMIQSQDDHLDNQPDTSSYHPCSFCRIFCYSSVIIFGFGEFQFGIVYS